MTTFEALTLTCPICGNLFCSRSVKSYSTRGKEADFKPRFQGESPLVNFLHTCPKCRFTGAVDGFKSSYKVEFKDYVRSNEYREKVCMSDVLARNPYYRAARLKERQGADRLALADLFLKASWVARDSGNGHEETTMQKTALDIFDEALAKDDLQEDDRVMVLYLSGELSRRLGNPKRALERIKAAHAHALGVKKLSGLLKLAEKQLLLIEEALNQTGQVAGIKEDSER